nr:hypothetical protein [uncultured Kingella sp.]
MIRRWLALTYYLYALRLAALSHFYFNRLYLAQQSDQARPPIFSASSEGKSDFRKTGDARTFRIRRQPEKNQARFSLVFFRLRPLQNPGFEHSSKQQHRRTRREYWNIFKRSRSALRRNVLKMGILQRSQAALLGPPT